MRCEPFFIFNYFKLIFVCSPFFARLLGQKVEAAAKTRGTNPQDWVDQNSVSFRKLLEIMNISNDQFIRTTEPNHKASVQKFWNVLVENGFIYLGYYEGWYSVRDECFYTEMELVDGKAPTGADVEWVTKEPSYFFKLSAFQDKLLDYYEKHPQCIAPESRKNEVLAFVRGGLRDLSISRTSFTWGVPVPGDSDHVMVSVLTPVTKHRFDWSESYCTDYSCIFVTTIISMYGSMHWLITFLPLDTPTLVKDPSFKNFGQHHCTWLGKTFLDFMLCIGRLS